MGGFIRGPGTRILQLAVVMVAVLALTTCGSDDTTSPGDSAGTIGPAGGTVSDGSGARIVVPAGALDHDVALTIAGVTANADLPGGGGPAPRLLGAVDCGPDGTDFAVPVTITIPAAGQLIPGETVPLHVWDPDAGLWTATPFVGTVAADGMTFSAQVTHFSWFGGFGGSGGLLSGLDQQLCDGVAPAALLASFQQLFRGEIAAVGDRGTWDQECREVVGLHWDLHAETGGSAADLIQLEGETGDGSLMFSYQVECSAGDGAGNALDAIVTIHHNCDAPDMSTLANPFDIEPGGSSTVTATVRCGDQLMAGRTVMFECFGPGDVAPVQAATNPAGQAQTMYTNDGDEGTATIRAYHDVCPGTGQAATISADAEVEIGSGWEGTLNVAFHQDVGDGPLGTFVDQVTVTFSFAVDLGVVIGDGDLVHAVTITPGDEECWLSSVNAPGFGIIVAGSGTAEQVALQFAPAGMLPLLFIITCDSDDPQNYSYPGHGLLEGMALTEDVRPLLSLADGATESGSGSQSFGEDIPLTYNWTVTLHRIGD